MTDLPPDSPNPNLGSTDATNEAENLLLGLRRKEGNWVKWGQACQSLQKAGYGAQTIFEETGFEPIQQNQVIVASQVYTSMVSAGVSEEVRTHFERTGSDTLYEFRILTQAERAAAATFVLKHRLDSIASKDVAKALKEFSRLRNLPDGFSNDPGDAVAYHYWRLARQQSDLQERSRLIANGLRFASSDTARKQIEKLLMDFTVVPKRPAPTLPIYRLESEEELPRVLPVVGKLPLTASELQAVPILDETGSFRIVKFAGEGAWVAVPGWQIVLGAEDPVAILCDREQLPNQQANQGEELLLVLDRAEREWDANSYFIVEQSGQLQIQWFEEATDMPLLGRLILALRPKRIVDENVTKDVWQIDE
jgi:Rubisco Assembly chaperone C-terminal domain/Rubisco accumulation factor 1 alpha helical domain/Rubisco accumulation factor 1 helix turn helix domain